MLWMSILLLCTPAERGRSDNTCWSRASSTRYGLVTSALTLACTHTHRHTRTQSFQCLPHACSIALSCTLSPPLLQLFSRDAETAESWMAAREAFFSKENVGASLDRVETLIRKSEDFDKSVKAQVGSLFPYLFP